VTNDLFFRVSFAALWLVFVVDVVLLSYLAKGSGVKQTTQHANRLQATSLLLAIVYFTGALLYILLPSWVMFLSIPFPDWFRLIMVGVAFLGILFISWGYWGIGKNWAPSVSGVRKDTILVTTGPYSFVRHPIYSGLFVSLAAAGLVTANLLILLPTLALLILLYASIGEEETMLVERFGNEYREYMKRTPRFIPKFRHEQLTLNSEDQHSTT